MPTIAAQYVGAAGAARTYKGASPVWSAGGVGADFNPLTQVTPLHAVWVEDPAWTNPGDGNRVASIRNVSGGGDPAQATNGPIFRSSVAVLNNKPALDFTASNSERLTVDIADVSQPFKLVVVYAPKTVAASLNIVGFGGASSHGFGMAGVPVGSYVSSGSILYETSTMDTNAHVALCTLNGNLSSIQIDGNTPVTGAAGATSLSRWKLASGGLGASDGRIADTYMTFCGIYAGATADVDLGQLADDLRAFYAIPA